MREFRFDTATRRAMLNGKVIYLRGASITLHRFFGDPKCGGLPWDEAWVRKFLVEIPKRMHWNAFRICIGPAPQHWLDIADEAGLLLQYEFPIWSDRDAAPTARSPQALEGRRRDRAVPRVHARQLEPSQRGHLGRLERDPLGLSRRQADSGGARPGSLQSALGERLQRAARAGRSLRGPSLPVHRPSVADEAAVLPDDRPGEDERGERVREAGRWTHAAIINEYDWLWLHRDGTPTTLARKVYEHLLGPDATPDSGGSRTPICLAGLTEFWRAYRNYAGVMYLAYLDGDLPHCFTCDNFRDVRRLELEPHFADYMGEAFKPLGVYVNFWQPSLPAGGERSYRVMMVNDTYEPARGKLELGWQSSSGAPAAAGAQRPRDIEFGFRRWEK